MYLRTEIEPGQGLGIAPVAKKVGEVVIEQVVEKIVGDWLKTPEGDFASLSNKVSVSRPNAPGLRDCVVVFPLTARVPLPLGFPPQKQNFWFQLFYRYNGNDLQEAQIIPLFDRTGKPGGQFKITFEGSEYEIDDPKFARVAKVRFSFGGSWQPFASRTPFSFRGFVVAWANGHVGAIVTFSEKDMVWVDDALIGRKLCPMLPYYLPPPPKTPVRKSFSLSPPILFPFNKATVSPNERQRIREWIKSWPATTREKIARGEITITIEGFASRPGGEYSESNVRLAKDRAATVVNILKDPLGSLAIPKFDVRSYGAWMRNLPRLFDVRQWLQRFFDPNKYDQAVVIRFEDVE